MCRCIVLIILILGSHKGVFCFDKGKRDVREIKVSNENIINENNSKKVTFCNVARIQINSVSQVVLLLSDNTYF